MKSKKLVFIIVGSAVVLLIVLAIGKNQGWFGNEGFLLLGVLFLYSLSKTIVV